MSNVGRIITDFYCAGAFGRDYDLSGSKIIAEGPDYVVIRKPDGRLAFTDFQIFDWNRHPDGTLSGGISNLTTLWAEEIQERIDDWCGGY